MSARALEFVEEWVSERIEQGYPATDDDAEIKAWAAACLAAARGEGISDLEIKEAFDDLAAFIGGQIDEARDRDEDREDDEDDDDDDDAADDDEPANDDDPAKSTH
jgi:hypothetical protein